MTIGERGSLHVEYDVEITELQQRCKSNTHRIDKLEKNTEAINKLATSVEVMAHEQKRTNEKVTAIDQKVSTLEALPGKRWNGVVDKILFAVVAAVIGYLLSKGGL